MIREWTAPPKSEELHVELGILDVLAACMKHEDPDGKRRDRFLYGKLYSDRVELVYSKD